MGSTMLWWVAQNTAIAAVLAGLVALICRLSRIGPAARHALWLVVLIKLMTPPLVLWPWALPDGLEPFHKQPAAAVDTPDAPMPQSHARQPADDDVGGVTRALPETGGPVVDTQVFVIPLDSHGIGEAAVPVPGTVTLPKPEQMPATPVVPVTATWRQPARWISLAGSLWLAGAVVIGMVHALRIVRLRRRLSGAEPVPVWLRQQVEELADRLTVRPPATFVVSGIDSPLLWALGRPKLLWPARLLGNSAPTGWQGVIVHELAHVRRRDHWVGWLELLAGCVWWPNPLFWYVRHQLRENAELACDAWVVETLPGHRRAYAEALLTVCQFGSNASNATAPMPALGIGSSTRRAFERRLTMIFREHVPFRISRISLLAVLVLGVLTLPGWSQKKPAVVQSEPEASVAEEPAVEADSDDVPVTPQFDGPVVTGEGKPPVDPVEPSARPVAQTNRKYNVSVNNRDKKVQALEKKLQALLQEVRALRSKKSVLAGSASVQRKRADGRGSVSNLITGGPTPGLYYHFDTKVADLEPGPSNVVETRTSTLVRTTYKLPKAKAEALAKFLHEHVDPEVQTKIQSGQGMVIKRRPGLFDTVETGFGASTITITTTPETQETIGRLIGLMYSAPTKPEKSKSNETYGPFDSEKPAREP